MGRVRINYRYYNPLDGRWIRRDPIGIEDGVKFPDSGKGFFIIALERGYPAYMFDIEYIKVEYEFDFLEACNKHDECYGGCGNSKSECDKQFLQDMLDSCSRNQSPNTVGACKHMARMYYDGVYIFGGDGYEKAQDKACEWASCK